MKRWIIRSFFIGLLLLCVEGWVATNHEYGFNHQGHDLWEAACNQGEIYLLFDSLEDRWTKVRRAWHWGVVEYPVFGLADSSLFGFAISNRFHGSDERWVAIPFWFPTTISAALLFLVWRKTRPKSDPNMAFPVEVKSAKTEAKK